MGLSTTLSFCVISPCQKGAMYLFLNLLLWVFSGLWPLYTCQGLSQSMYVWETTTSCFHANTIPCYAKVTSWAFYAYVYQFSYLWLKLGAGAALQRRCLVNLHHPYQFVQIHSAVKHVKCYVHTSYHNICCFGECLKFSASPQTHALRKTHSFRKIEPPT